MFAQPRARKSALPPPSKKRKAVHSVEEINFDNNARAEYLTGFHRRKVQRQKHAQEIAVEQARLERIRMRKRVRPTPILRLVCLLFANKPGQLRDGRKQAVEDHVKQVNDLLKEAQRAGQDDDSSASEQDDWDGFEDEQPVEPIDHEAEYIDEDRYTTVTVEAVTVDRDGLHKPEEPNSGDDAPDGQDPAGGEAGNSGQDKKAPPKKKKRKFRYETKLERQLSERTQKAKKGR